jgi:hypothetical protein
MVTVLACPDPDGVRTLRTGARRVYTRRPSDRS